MTQTAAHRESAEPSAIEEDFAAIEQGDDSREKILRAAEQLFAEKGLAGASVRAITSAAGVNHALVGYYFGSKVALYEEVLERAGVLLGAPKLARLAELREQYGETPIPTREILEAYIRSFFDDYGNPQSIQRTWLRFYGRCFSELDDEVNLATNRSGDHIRNAFLQEFERTLPELSRKALVYRFGAMIGAIAFWRGETGLLEAHFEEEEQSHVDVDELTEELISICSALFAKLPDKGKTPAPKTKNKSAAMRNPAISHIKTGELSKPKVERSRRHRKRVETAG